MKKAVVLLNFGGPSSLDGVRPFLFNLFYDKRIINLPNPFRFILAKLISIKRENATRKIYAQIGGQSSIVTNTKIQADKLEQHLNQGNAEFEYKVFLSMRYSYPYSDNIIEEIKHFDPYEVILLPLYPQYSTTTTLSSIENWYINCHKHGLLCRTNVIYHYYDNKDFISAQSKLIYESYKIASKVGKPRILFSSHSLPLSIVKNGDPYALQIEKTAKLIVEKLAIQDLDWSVCYQSKIGYMKWLEPSTKSELFRAKNDNIPVVLSPISFVSENSETLYDLDIDYKQLIKHEYYFRVPTVSTHELFIKCLGDLCKKL